MSSQIKGCITNINKQNVLAKRGASKREHADASTERDTFRGLTCWQRFKREIQVSGSHKGFCGLSDVKTHQTCPALHHPLAQMCLAPRLCHIATNHLAAVAVLPSCPRGGWKVASRSSSFVVFVRRSTRQQSESGSQTETADPGPDQHQGSADVMTPHTIS